MAMELQVYVAVINTEPEVPGNPGIIVRSQKMSTLVTGSQETVEQVWTLASAQLAGMCEEVQVDARHQIEIMERAAQMEGI